MRVPSPREAFGQVKPRHCTDPDSNRQEVSEADRSKSSSLNSFYPLAKCGSQTTLWVLRLFPVSVLHTIPTDFNKFLVGADSPHVMGPAGLTEARKKNMFQQTKNKPHHHTETAEVPEAAQVSVVYLETPTYQQLKNYQEWEITKIHLSPLSITATGTSHWDCLTTLSGKNFFLMNITHYSLQLIYKFWHHSSNDFTWAESSGQSLHSPAYGLINRD